MTSPLFVQPPSSYIGEMTFRLVAHVIQYHHSLESVFSSWQFHVYFRCSLARTIIFIWSEKCWVTTCRKSKWLFTMFALHHCAVRTHTQKRERENLLNKSVFNTSARSYPRLELYPRLCIWSWCLAGRSGQSCLPAWPVFTNLSARRALLFLLFLLFFAIHRLLNIITALTLLLALIEFRSFFGTLYPADAPNHL